MSTDICPINCTIAEPSGSYTRFFNQIIDIPVGSRRNVELKIQKQTLSSQELIVLGYRRIGTNS